MRKNRKILAVLLTLALALSLLPTAAFAAGGTCEHRKSATDPNAITTTLEDKTATAEANYNCTAIAYLQACKVCSVCDGIFTDYETDAEGTTNKVADADKGQYVYEPTSGAAHSWTDGACTNTVNSKPCTATHSHVTSDFELKDEKNTCKVCGFVCEHKDQSGATCSVCGATLTQPSEGTAPSITGTATAKSAGSNQFDVSYKYTAGTGDKAVAVETVTFSFVLKDGSTAVTEGATVPQDATGEANKTDYTAALTVPEGTTAKTYTLTITATASNKAVATVDVTVSYAPTGTNPPVGDKATIASVAYDVATKTLSWTYTPATVAAKADPAFKVTLKSGSTVVKEAEDIAATLTDGKYTAEYAPAGITFGDATAYTIVVSLSTDETVKGEVTVPAKGDQPGPENKNVQPASVTYNYSTGKLTWTLAEGSNVTEANQAFKIIVKLADGTQKLTINAHIGDATTDTLSASLSGTTYTVTNYKPDLENGSYIMHVYNPAAPSDTTGKEVTFTVATTAVDTIIDSLPSEPNQEQATTAANQLIAAAGDTTVGDSMNNFADSVIGKVDDIKKVENAAKPGVTVEESTDRNAPAGMTMSEVVGLKLSATGNATITVGAADNTNRNVPSETKSSVFFSVKVSGRVNSRLSFPVAVTVGIPSSMQSLTLSTLKVVHYDGSTKTPEVLRSTVDTGAKTITFVTWSFSDFAIVSTQEGGGNNGGSSGSNTPNKGSSSTGGGKVTVTTPSTTTPSVTVTASGFSDVPDTHTFSAEIKWAKDNGYMNGTGEGVFSPAGTVNRQQIWMVLARMAGANPANMAEALTWAVENGISDGTNPTGAVSRQQLVTMMFRFAQKQENAPSEAGADISTFSDAAQVSGYAQEALAWSVANNIVGGTADGRLNPYGNATRGAFAAILYRYYN